MCSMGSPHHTGSPELSGLVIQTRTKLGEEQDGSRHNTDGDRDGGTWEPKMTPMKLHDIRKAWVTSEPARITARRTAARPHRKIAVAVRRDW